MYSAFHETIVAKHLYRKLRFYNRFMYCGNLIYLTYGKICLILYIVWGVGVISSQVFGHLGSFKSWIQTEACVIPSRNRETNRDIISVAVIPSKQKLFVQPKLKHNNVHLINITEVQDCEMHYMNAWLKRCDFNLDLNRESVSEPRTLSGRLFQRLGDKYEKVLPPLVDFAILGTTKSPEFCDLRERVGL